MPLASLTANGGFRQWSLRIYGNHEASREAGNLVTALVFELFLLEQKQRVQLAAGNPKDHCRPPQAVKPT